MILLGTGADSDVYQSDCGDWVYKVYRTLQRNEIDAYHAIQSSLSQRIKESSQKSYQDIPLLNNRKIEILNTGDCQVFDDGIALCENPSFSGKVVSKIPYIEGTNLDEYPEVELYEAFTISNKIRDRLHDTIGFPIFIDINPMNIRISPEGTLIITDVASEIESLIYL